MKEQSEKNVAEAAGLADARNLLVQSVRTSPDVPTKHYKPRTLSLNQAEDSSSWAYCKKPGHVIQNSRNPGCKVSKQSLVKSQLAVKPVLSVSVSETDIFDPYTRKGSVSLPNVTTKYNVNILRDTSAANCVPDIVLCPIAKAYVESSIYILDV